MPAVQDRRSRDRRGRIASICGRRHCSHCSRWLLITEFGVERWADAAKTEVSHLKRDCRSCRSRQAREGRARHETLRRSNAEACLRWRRAQKAKKAKQVAPPLPDFYRVDRVIDSLDRDQLRQYNLENCLSIVQHHGVSLADEDYDPTPVPTGCAGCWRRDGSEPCTRCPSPPSRQERRDRGSYRVALLRVSDYDYAIDRDGAPVLLAAPVEAPPEPAAEPDQAAEEVAKAARGSDARRRDAVVDAARTLDDLSPAGVEQLVRRRWRGDRSITPEDIQSFSADARAQRVHDVADALDFRIRRSVYGRSGSKQPHVQIPRGIVGKSLASLDPEEKAAVVARLRDRGWSGAQIKRFGIRRVDKDGSVSSVIEGKS